MTSIALVVLDTLRKDAFDRHFDWLPGRRFERAYSTASWTVPAHASLFTGRYPSEAGVHAKNMYFDFPAPVLAERLRDEGFTTRAYSANTNITGHFDFDRGFVDFRTPDRFEHLTDDSLFDWREFSRGTRATGKRKYLRGLYEVFTSDVATLPSLVNGLKLKLNDGMGVEYGGAAEALEEVRNIEFGDREFLFLNVMDAHEPYRAPPEYMTVDEPPLTQSVGDISFEPVDAARTKQAYDDCASYLSDVYRELFDALSAEFDYVITLSDHGESLGERDVWGHEHGIYPELTHVPLCISGDGITGSRAESVSILDVHETVLAAAGLEGESENAGQSLLGPVDGRERLTEFRGLTSWSKRNLENDGYGAQVEEYDRTLRGFVAESDYYGYETLDGFAETGTATVDSPHERLDDLVDGLDVRHVERNNEVPDDVKEHLRDLGYA